MEMTALRENAAFALTSPSVGSLWPGDFDLSVVARESKPLVGRATKLAERGFNSLSGVACETTLSDEVCERSRVEASYIACVERKALLEDVLSQLTGKKSRAVSP